MAEKRDEWCFVRMRAAQLFEEGEVKAVLRLMKALNREQICLLEKQQVKCEQIENC